MPLRKLIRASARASVPRRIVSLSILALGLLAWFFCLRPTTLGGPMSLVTVSGISMQPTMYTGDLAVVYRRHSYTDGEVIEYRVTTPSGGRSIVIHRIVGGDARDGFITRGDNNDWPDPWRPTPADIVGAMAFHVPQAGSLLTFVGRPVNLAAILGGITAFVILLRGGRRRPKTADDERDQVGSQGASAGASDLESPATAGRK